MTAAQVSACAVCSLHRNCAEMAGLMAGLARWVDRQGFIPDGLGGTIGLAMSHAQLALLDCDRSLRQPYANQIRPAIAETRSALTRFRSIAGRRCGPEQVGELANLAFVAQANSWDAAAVVYRR
ncbi:MAG: hypothetical protein ACREN4_07140 [Candidatus Dormibacteria bacterium]